MSKREAARAAQTELVVGGAGIKVDGIWGARTQGAYDGAKPVVRLKADDALATFGYTVKDFGLVGNWISEADLRPLIDTAAAATGRSADMLTRFIGLEAAKRMRNGVREFNASSVAPSGLFHGLMQMGRPAWSDVQAAWPVTPSFMDGRYDPSANILAGARYSILNERYLRSKGYRGAFSLEVMYAAHNQGAAGFMRLLNTGKRNGNYNNQSAQAKAMISTALAASGVVLA